ncbi:unnamed protein product [Miscanthus lutarioriparius]|uniref:NAC domain-containing protein n=1 Tax=Miscanthus lutarioriparius TaxID=422564 RepID=A0A811SIZ0_9POAL|nr:unnamed protein product [Miscanthus lutarioriparius]
MVSSTNKDSDESPLPEKYKESGVDDTWYFLSPRYRKYRAGDRPVRRTADDRGRWKPSTGQSKPPEEEDASTSHSKAKKAAFSENTLAYYVGSTKDETKTKWLMHELVVPKTPDNGFHIKSAAAEPRDDMLLNRYVVCRIYKSPLRKWKEIEEAAAEVPTPSQPSGPPPERVGEAAAQAPSSRQQPPAKRPAVERPATSGHTGAPNKGVSQMTLFLGGGRSAPTRGNGGGSSVRMPPVGAGAGAAGHHGPGLPALVHWPPPVYNSMQGPVQVQQPPLVYGYGNRAAGTPSTNGQAAPVLRLPPPHRAAATAPNSLGPKTMMRPPNLAAGQPARLPSPRQQQQQHPPPPPPETEEACRNRVYARLIAEMKLQKAQQDSAARAGQQRIGQTASAQPACFHDEGGDRPAGAEAMVSPAQFPAPHGGCPYSSSNVAQRPQWQQSSSVAPAPAAVEKAPAAENVPSKQSVPPAPGANEGSCNCNYRRQHYFADFDSRLLASMNEELKTNLGYGTRVDTPTWEKKWIFFFFSRILSYFWEQRVFVSSSSF